MNARPIGIFDSGYGGLTIMKEITALLPAYDYIYLGDNARTPYGNRGFQTVYEYTIQCTKWFFDHGCPLVILACNTASAKALRTIQQNDLPNIGDNKKVLGVIRPTTEVIGNYSKSGHIGIIGTSGTIQSNSYVIEINKFFPNLVVTQEACPIWVALVENNEYESPGADYFVQKHITNLLSKDGKIDTILLACTHYPLLIKKIQQFIPVGVTVISQGKIIAESLKVYMERHPEIAKLVSRNSVKTFFTTGEVMDFNSHGSYFYGENIQASRVHLV